MLAKLEKHAQLVFEHKPKELRVAVNGNFQGTLKVNSDLNEIDLAVADKEPIEFIEIYSEQQLRLLFLNFDNSIPHRTADSTYSLNFSNERFLQVNVGFVAQGAEIKLSYQDPTYKQVQAILENRNAIDEVVFPISENGHQIPPTHSVGNRFVQYFSNLTSLLSFGWRRFALACLLVMIGIGGWVILDRQSKQSAKAILEEAEIKKLSWQYQPDKIVYWEMEEIIENSPNLPSGRYLSKWWSNNLNGQRSELILRYDQQGQLVSGRWIKADATEIFFARKRGSQIIVNPGLPLIKQNLSKLTEEEKAAMQKHIAIAERVTDIEQMAKGSIARMFRGRSEESVKKHLAEGIGEVLCVNVKSNYEIPQSGIKGSQSEYEFNETTLQQIRFRRNVFLNDGGVWSEESRLLSSGESTLEEFENNELAKMMADPKNVKYVSVEERAKELAKSTASSK